MAAILRARGLRVAAVRHPMPYGDLRRQAVQRFESVDDLAAERCTIEEMEEYEPHIEAGCVVFAGCDYARILAAAERECDVVLWDGGNNDTPFFRSDLEIVLVDPHRAGHELTHYPGQTNFRRADVLVIAKIDSADPAGVDAVRASIRTMRPDAAVVESTLALTLDGDASELRGKRVLCVEDGPTLTHGGMAYGAAVLAARQFGAAELVDPRPHAVGSLASTLEAWPHLDRVLPAMGYGEAQVRELAETIERTPCDAVLIGTPVDLRRVSRTERPSVRVRYEHRDIGKPTMESVLDDWLMRSGIGSS